MDTSWSCTFVPKDTAHNPVLGWLKIVRDIWGLTKDRRVFLRDIFQLQRMQTGFFWGVAVAFHSVGKFLSIFQWKNLSENISRITSGTGILWSTDYSKTWLKQGRFQHHPTFTTPFLHLPHCLGNCSHLPVILVKSETVFSHFLHYPKIKVNVYNCQQLFTFSTLTVTYIQCWVVALLSGIGFGSLFSSLCIDNDLKFRSEHRHQYRQTK